MLTENWSSRTNGQYLYMYLYIYIYISKYGFLGSNGASTLSFHWLMVTLLFTPTWITWLGVMDVHQKEHCTS